MYKFNFLNYFLFCIKMIRKYTTKSGEVKVYNYTKNTATNATNKRKYLINFIEKNRKTLDKLATKKSKIDYVLSNIDRYNYSYSTVNRYI